MTAPDAFPPHMDRFALDASTAERLMRGAVDLDDAPPPYRAVADVLQALRAAPEPPELAREREVVEQIAAAVMLERKARPMRSSRRPLARVAGLAATAVIVCALPLTGGLASAGALPDPAQNLASTVLGKVGISVPTRGQPPADTEPAPLPAPPSTTAAPPATTGWSPAAGGPGPDNGERPPGVSRPAAPGKGRGNLDGTPARGTPPNKADKQGGAHAPKDPGEGNNGNG